MSSYICQEPFALSLGNRPFLRLRVKQTKGDTLFVLSWGSQLLQGLEVLVPCGWNWCLFSFIYRKINLIAVTEQPESVKKLFIADHEQGRGCLSGEGFSLKSCL